MKTIKTTLFVALILLLTNLLSGQNRIVSGTLTDDNGDAIPSVNIIQKGTKNGTITDINGRYEITAPLGSVLVFSFIGFDSSEMKVTEANSVPAAVSNPDNQIPNPSKTIETTTDEENEQDIITETKVYRHEIPGDGSKTLSPYFFVQSDNPLIDRMPLKSTSATVNIASVIADITVKQVYANEGKNPIEAIYIFPGSTKAAVYGMVMQIGNRGIVAKIKEKQQARTEYEQAKQEGKTATLLEQKRPNVFQMNVANILPGDTITVELKYTELIEPTDGIYEFVYPTVVEPRYSETPDTPENSDEQWLANSYLEEGEKPTYTFDIRALINTGIPIQKINSTSHDVNIRYTGKSVAVVTMSETEQFAGNKDFILKYGLRGNKVESGLLLHEHDDENFFLLLAEPPKTPAPEQIPPREYVFIIDVSGSMHGFPLNTAKELMKQLFRNLKETDMFNVMFFSGGSKMLSKKPIPATKVNLARALTMINKLDGGGGTQICRVLCSD